MDIRNLIDTVLSQAGFQVITAANGQEGVEAVRRYDPIVTTLDVNMPGMDGFEVARRIRAFSMSYIVMLTALSEEIDTVQGLEAGADDFVSKPFRPRELRARVEAMLRRPRAAAVETAGTTQPEPVVVVVPQPVTAPVVAMPVTAPVIAQPVVSAVAPVFAGPPEPAPVVTIPAAPTPVFSAPPAPVAIPEPVFAPASSAPVASASPVFAQPAAPVQASVPPAAAPAPSTQGGSGWLEHNGLWLNLETRIVQVDRTEVLLTRSEFDLLATLLESGRRVRTKADLVLHLRGDSYVTSHIITEPDKRAIEVHMGNLRKKLSDSIAAPRFIETVRGVGYRLTAPDAA